LFEIEPIDLGYQLEKPAGGRAYLCITPVKRSLFDTFAQLFENQYCGTNVQPYLRKKYGWAINFTSILTSATQYCKIRDVNTLPTFTEVCHE